MSESIGQIRFIREDDGALAVDQKWNPSLIPRHDRATAAIVLRGIADALDRDEFEVDGEYKYFGVPELVGESS